MKQAPDPGLSFQTDALEAQALAVMQLLAGQPLPQGLSPSAQRQVKALAKALQQGQKTEAFKCSQPFYKKLLDPELVKQAYLQISQLEIHSNPDCQIVLDSLRFQYSAAQLSARLSPLPLEDALVYILLVITCSDKNSISYLRQDSNTGRSRPTTFPLTPELIQHFLVPFELEPQNLNQVLKRAVFLRKNTVLGNPAAEVVWRYQQRKTAFESTQVAQLQIPAKPTSQAVVTRPEKAGQLAQKSARTVRSLLAEVQDPHEKAAVKDSLSPGHFYNLLPLSQQEDDSFQQQLRQIYTQRLSSNQADMLAARLASRMKRLLAEMGDWNEQYWSEFHTLMQGLGLWEGTEWLEKWRSYRKGKQELALMPMSAESEETRDLLAEMLRRQELMADKQRGRKMLGQTELVEIDPRWLQPPQSKASPEMQKVLIALGQTSNLVELVEVACPDGGWSELDKAYRKVFVKEFEAGCYSDLPEIKDRILASARSAPQVKQVLAALELKINQIIRRLQKEPRAVFVDILQQLKIEEQALQEREKQNSLAYRRSPAAQYGKYQKS